MDLKQRYLEFLATEGYRPTLDDDGDISFKAEGKTFVLFDSGEDRELVRLGAVNIWSIDDADELQQALTVASEISARFKVAKAFVVNEQAVYVTAEGFYTDPTHFEAAFHRLLSATQASAADFGRRMRELRAAAPAAKA